MKVSHSKTREEARRFYLTGEMSTNAEIAARLKVKPHTVGRWSREEDWAGLRIKIDRRAAEMFTEKIASERTSLNVRHYRMWDLLVAKLAETLKGKPTLDTRELERISAVLNRAQQGQRLAKGLSLSGETEEAIRAQSEAETRAVIDAFIDAVKEHVPDEESRDRIRQAILEALPEEAGDGAGESGDAFVH
jgi:Mn-dependent DtxR family transcriptional regulator